MQVMISARVMFLHKHPDCNYTGATLIVDEILLSPPPSITASEGDTVLVPCVGSVDTVFSGPLPGATQGNVSRSGFTFIAGHQDNGVLSCEVGAEKQDVNITVIGN